MVEEIPLGGMEVRISYGKIDEASQLLENVRIEFKRGSDGDGVVMESKEAYDWMVTVLCGAYYRPLNRGDFTQTLVRSFGRTILRAVAMWILQMDESSVGYAWQCLEDYCGGGRVVLHGVEYDVAQMAVATSVKAWLVWRSEYLTEEARLGWRPNIHMIRAPTAVADEAEIGVRLALKEYTRPYHYTTQLFGTLLLGLQRLEDMGVLALAHHAMLEDMLGCWRRADDVGLGDLRGRCHISFPWEV